jgi:hypothetical protein
VDVCWFLPHTQVVVGRRRRRPVSDEDTPAQPLADPTAGLLDAVADLVDPALALDGAVVVPVLLLDDARERRLLAAVHAGQRELAIVPVEAVDGGVERGVAEAVATGMSTAAESVVVVVALLLLLVHHLLFQLLGQLAWVAG